MRHTKRKGFTIVELVIVIAVIGILSAILIPTFVNITKQGKVASEQSFVKNVNTALAMDGTHKTMHAALKAAEKNTGWDLDAYKPSEGNILVWDSVADRFAIVGEEGVDNVIVSDGGGLKAAKNVELFRIYDSFDFATQEQKFSIYASDNWDQDCSKIGWPASENEDSEDHDDHPLVVGFDVGENFNFTKGLYKRDSSADSQSALLNTGDCVSLEFVIDAPTDTIAHFGKADKLTIEAVNPHSYHEHGAIQKPVEVKAGRVVLESGSNIAVVVNPPAPEAPVPVVEKKGSSVSTVEYTGHATAGISIDSVRMPKFVLDYNSRTSNLDSIDNIEGNSNPNRNTYYENEEGGADIYKIGDDNAFAFPIYGIKRDASLNEAVYRNPAAISVAITADNGGTAPTWTNGILDPTGATKDKVYTLTAGTATFKFMVVEGYNVTNAKELSLFDNTSSLSNLYIGTGDDQRPVGQTYDKWKDIKKAVFGDDYGLLNPSALILHGDINVTNNDLPAEVFWTPKEINHYFAEHPDDLAQYTIERNEGREAFGLPLLTEPEIKRLLSTSMKDDVTLYYRANGRELVDYHDPNGATHQYWLNENDLEYLNADPETHYDNIHDTYFSNLHKEGVYKVSNNQVAEGFDVGDGNMVVEGNYFKIDASSLNQVAFFDTLLQAPVNGSIYQMRLLHEAPYKLIEGSHATLFGVNNIGAHAAYKNIAPWRGNGGQVDFKNLTLLGNAPRSNDTKNKGGLIGFKIDCTVGNFTNINASHFFTAFYSQVGWYKQPVFDTEMHIDRCKSFDSYNSMFYFYGTDNNTLTNSCGIGAGGPLALLDERNRYALEAEAHQHKDNKVTAASDYQGFVATKTSLDATNVYLENFVLGTEPWFATKPPEIVGGLVSTIKSNATSWLQSYALADEEHAGRNYIKLADNDTVYMNLIAADIDVGGLAGPKPADNQYKAPLNGSVTIHKKGNPTEVSAYSSLEKFNSAGGSIDPVLATYRAAYRQSSAGLVYHSSAGGHAMLGPSGPMTVSPSYGPQEALDQNLVKGEYMSAYLILNKTAWGAISMLLGMQQQG